MSDVSNTEAAAALHALGLPGFFVDANKRPTVDGGFKNATRDLKELYRLAANPLAKYIAMPTGEQSRLFVVDIDKRNGGMEWLALNAHRLPATFTVHTKNEGRHIYFRYPAGLRSSHSRIARGIDIQAAGAYVVCWHLHGYESNGLRVAEAPEWLLVELLKGQHGASAMPAINVADLAPPSADALVALLRDMPNPETTSRADWLACGLATVGCIRGLESLGKLDPDDAEAIEDVWVEWAEKWPRPSDDNTEHREKFRDDFAKRDNNVSGWPHLLTFAERCGADTTQQRHDMTVAEFGVLPDEADAPTASAPAQPISRLRMLSPTDCEAAEGRGYIVKGLIAPRDVACLFGPPGAGKSVVAPHVGYAVAQGRDVFGRRTRAGTAFYVAAEDPHGMRQRVHGLKLTHGDAPDFALVEGVGSMLDATQADELRALIAEHRPALIFIDTLAMAFPGLRENESEDMGRVVAMARSLTEHGAAVVLIHHDRKDSDGTPRGHSLFNGALDVALQLVKADDEGVIRGELTKNRNGPCDATVAFRIRSVSLGQDEDGDLVTTPVAMEVEQGHAAKAPKLPRTAAAALDVLKRLVADSGEPTSDGRVVALEDDWRAACDDQRVSTSDDPKNRRDVISRAFATLRDGKHVFAGNGHVWLPTVATAAAEFGTFSDDSDNHATIAAIAPLSARDDSDNRATIATIAPPTTRDDSDSALKGYRSRRRRTVVDKELREFIQ